jgi:patatin-like phospholipase/acyl hydrolase
MSNKVFKILAIDGGGIKGLYSAKILEHFEDKFKCQISDKFDMLCGTSTGGIIALGLSLKIPASELSKFYEKYGPSIFPNRSKLFNIFRQVAWRGKYSDITLKKALQNTFGEKVIGESSNLLCIPTYTITEARPWVFKFDHTILGRDNKAKYVDVALATSAAPTYFPMAEISYYDNKQFIDGGVWANNPTLVGYIEALTYFVGKDKPYDELQILSLSSLSLTGGKPTGLKRHRPFISWRNELFETSMTGQSMFTNYFMEKTNGITEVPVSYFRIPSANVSSEQESLVQLDVANKKALDLIKGKGNDQGEIYKKKEEISKYFEFEKTFKIQ